PRSGSSAPQTCRNAIRRGPFDVIVAHRTRTSDFFRRSAVLLRQLMMRLVRVRIVHAALAALTLAIVLGRATPVRTQDVTAQAGTPPAAGDVIFNEYMSDNDANGNDFVELLVMRDGVDLRGMRFSDNEYSTATGTLNNNEAVFTFGHDAFLSNVPSGTLIAVYQLAAGVVTP